MLVKLNDKEISALAKKMASIDDAKINAEKKALSKSKLAQAKQVKATLDSLPEEVLHWLYERRYARGFVTTQAIADILAKNTSNDCSKKRSEDYESDVILAAYEAKDMASLCKKLGI